MFPVIINAVIEKEARQPWPAQDAPSQSPLAIGYNETKIRHAGKKAVHVLRPQYAPDGTAQWAVDVSIIQRVRNIA